MRVAAVLSKLPLTGYGGSTVNGPAPGDPSPLTVSSLDLPAGTVPREFTCDGANRRPRLEWSTPPPGTQELAIELLDPDAPGGTFTHWVVYGIPSGVSSLAAVPARPRLTVIRQRRRCSGQRSDCLPLVQERDVRSGALTGWRPGPSSSWAVRPVVPPEDRNVRHYADLPAGRASAPLLVIEALPAWTSPRPGA